MLLDDAKGGFHVVAPQRLGDMRATGVVVALERPRHRGHFGRLLVGVAGHDGGDGARQGAALVGVVGQAVAHDERAEIGVTQPQRAEYMRVLGDLFDRIAGVIHNDFLRGNE